LKDIKRLSKKEIEERQSDTNSSIKSLERSNMNWNQKLRKYVGIASAGASKIAEATAKGATAVFRAWA